ncbi:hypothetical protein B9Z55_005364 [Caenorhabditis nigoni]|uniref:Uncharacterized protein n=1 Tax=Caenorhabditis nigoni TaxID=1611254 RepID=A0A2G5V0L0_9PELO|nr:hypothetical protein B9Z55_005364 [Caenorhabditis nigoni]
MSLTLFLIVTSLFESIVELGKHSRRCPIKMFALEPYFRMNSETEKPLPKHMVFCRQYFEMMLYPKIHIDDGSHVPETSKKSWKAKHAVSFKKRCQR